MGLEFTTHYKDGVEGFLPGLIEAIKDKYASTTTQGSSELAAAYQSLINALFDPNSYKGQDAAAGRNALKLEQSFHDAFAFASRGSGDSYGGVYQVGRNQGFQDEAKRRDEQLKVLKQMDRVANKVMEDLQHSPVQNAANVSKLMAQIQAIQADLHRFNIGADEKYNRLRKKDTFNNSEGNVPLATSYGALFNGASAIYPKNFDQYFASLYNAYANSIGAYLGRENAKILGLTGENLTDIVNAAIREKAENIKTSLEAEAVKGFNSLFLNGSGQRYSRSEFARNIKQRSTAGSSRTGRMGKAYTQEGKNGVWDGNIAKNLAKIQKQIEGQVNIKMDNIKGYLDNKVFVSVQQKADSFAASLTIATTADVIADTNAGRNTRTWTNVGMSVKNWSDMFGDYATFGHTTAAKALMRTLSSVTNERGTYQALGLATSPTKYIARDWLTMLKAAAAYDILVGISQGQGHQADLIVIRDNKRNGGNLFKVYSGYDLLVENLDKVCQSITFEPEPSFPIPATMRGARAAYALNYLEGIKVSLGTGFLK